jgi:flavin-dependent dehydrogenase
MVSDLVVAPESLMRGFSRTPTGPGWALAGDAGHFKHPGTAQGIGDAVEQAIRLAELLSGANPNLESYADWRDTRASEHYEWPFTWGRFPRPESENLFRGWAVDPDAAQDLRDSFSRRVEPRRCRARSGSRAGSRTRNGHCRAKSRPFASAHTFRLWKHVE